MCKPDPARVAEDDAMVERLRQRQETEAAERLERMLAALRDESQE